MLKKTTLLGLCVGLLLVGVAYCGLSHPGPVMSVVCLGLPLALAGWALAVGE